MTTKVWHRAIAASTIMAVLVAGLAVYAFLAAVTTNADSLYTPATTVKMCNDMPASFPDADIAGSGTPCTENLALAAAADYTNTLTIPSGNVDASVIVTMAPGFASPSGKEDITAGGLYPPGTKVGGQHADTTLGLLGGACNTAMSIDTVLYNVALPNSPVDPRSTTGPGSHGSSTNIAFPQSQGVVDRFSHWKVGDQADGTSAGGDQIVTSTNGIQADGTTLAVQNYPSYLLDMFDPDFVPGVGDGPTKPIVPLAVYGGLTNVASTWTPLYFAAFSEGGLLTMPAPLGLLTAPMGQPSVSVLNDPTAVLPSVGSITSSCTPLNAITMLLGTSPAPGSHVRATNPDPVGTGFFQEYTVSLRDLDQDGYENALDSCPTIADPTHNPRNPPGPANNDADSDGIGNACDSVGNPSVTDQDSDGFSNTQDDCPQVADASQQQSSLGFTQADNGPRADGIGDACESGTATFMQNGQSVTVSLTDHTVAHGRFMVAVNVVAKCFGGTDADGDGYCSTQDTGTDSLASPCGSTVPPSCTVRHNAWGAAITDPLDTDGDGFPNAVETYLGTDGTARCAKTPVPPSNVGGVNDEGPLDNWPFDFNDDRLAGLADVTAYAPAFGLPVNSPPATKRFDLNVDGLVGLADIVKFSTVFSHRCLP